MGKAAESAISVCFHFSYGHGQRFGRVECTLKKMLRARYAPYLFRNFWDVYEATFGDFWRFWAIAINFGRF
jgi:hypothetical protein